MQDRRWPFWAGLALGGLAGALLVLLFMRIYGPQIQVGPVDVLQTSTNDRRAYIWGKLDKREFWIVSHGYSYPGVLDRSWLKWDGRSELSDPDTMDYLDRMVPNPSEKFVLTKQPVPQSLRVTHMWLFSANGGSILDPSGFFTVFAVEGDPTPGYIEMYSGPLAFPFDESVQFELIISGPVNSTLDAGTYMARSAWP